MNNIEKEKRIIEIFNKILEKKINIENLSVIDIIDLSKYLYNISNKLNQEIYEKKYNLYLLVQELNNLS